jgi:L,D-peptidoglycan transpeptidase YkuD (ErfK/YbiS/YcfS/YnhG family)|tara:strand:+ start:99745 stop:100251 length:507 start_codon:yes stop_codon:yes gene_type:complete
MIDRIVVDTASRTLIAGELSLPCLIGKGGAIAEADKAEGDGATPLGEYRLLTVLVRPDRMPAPTTRLPWRWLSRSDGWSDGATDPAYNYPIRHPHGYSAEHLWREDGLYDLIVTTDHNTPPKAGAGSAIFLHCTVNGRTGTEGCVAVARDELFRLLASLSPGAIIAIG